MGNPETYRINGSYSYYNHKLKDTSLGAVSIEYEVGSESINVYLDSIKISTVYDWLNSSKNQLPYPIH